MSDQGPPAQPAFRFDEVFRGAPDAIFVMDKGGTILDANDQAERFLGYPASELVGHRASDFVVRDQLETSNRRLDALATGVPVEPARRVFVRADGSRVPGEIFVAVVPRDPPAEHLLVSVIRDVSGTVHLDRLQAEQSVRLQALGTLASGVAHDLNNILASIIGFTELAHEQLAEASGPARDLERALSAADKARKLAAQVLAFGRERGARLEPVDLEQAIVQIIRLVRSTLPAGVDLQFSSDHSHAVVLGDQTRLQQVVLNLCANAGKAIGAGGGRVRIALEAYRV
ncbi:MAG: two-component system sensor histidine kinase NtrB, partial [Spirochaetota bacterium]